MNSQLMRMPMLWTLSKGIIQDLRYSKDTTLMKQRRESFYQKEFASLIATKHWIEVPYMYMWLYSLLYRSTHPHHDPLNKRKQTICRDNVALRDIVQECCVTMSTPDFPACHLPFSIHDTTPWRHQV